MLNNKRNRDRDLGEASEPALTMQKLAEIGYSFNMSDERGLTVSPDRTLAFRGFVFTPTHLTAPDDATEEDYLDVFGLLKPIISASSFWIGDSINAAEKTHGEKYVEAERITGLKNKTLRNIASVCRHVHLSRRKDKLTFKHHVHVTDLQPEMQEYWLSRAVEEHLSATKLKRLITGKAGSSEWRKKLPEGLREVDKEVSDLMKLFAAKQQIGGDYLRRVGGLVNALWEQINATPAAESEKQDASN